MRYIVLAAALLHAIFMIAELFPLKMPLLLERLLKERKVPVFEGDSLTLVSAIVRNAGIYNGIIAGGLIWAYQTGDSANDVALVLLAGAAVAGIFGTLTLKSPATALQAALGIAGLVAS